MRTLGITGVVVVLALLWGTTPAAQAPQVPEAVSPFPRGLSGTLAFQSDLRSAGNPNGHVRIYTIDLATGVVTALTNASDWDDENPRWSPDGTRIAFKSNRNGASNYDLYVMDADGRNPVRITDDPANDHDPAWMPDGQSLVFMSERGSRGDLYRVWLSDLSVERLTDHFEGHAIMPNVSPDGAWVAFAAQTLPRDGGWTFQIHVLELATKMTWPFDESGPACWPSWSPDGQSIAHVSLNQEPSVIQTLNSFGTSPEPLPGDPDRWHYYPDWSPDGRLLAVSVSPEHHAGEDWDLALIDPSRVMPERHLTTGAGNDRLPDWRPRAEPKGSALRF
jgi:Tol biopolymer transport system component